MQRNDTNSKSAQHVMKMIEEQILTRLIKIMFQLLYLIVNSNEILCNKILFENELKLVELNDNHDLIFN